MKSKIGHIIAAVSLLLVVLGAPAHASDNDDPPQIIQEAFQPGSDLFNQALDLLEYEGEVSSMQAKSATSAATSAVTYSKPLRTAFLELEEKASGPLTDHDFSPLPDRYIAVQYIDNKPQGAYTVDVTGEFIQMGGEEEEVLAAFEEWPQGAIYGTDGIIGVSAEISADGSTVRALDDNTRELFGQETLSADEFRTLVAKEYQKLLDTDDSPLEVGADGLGLVSDTSASGISPLLLVGLGAVLATVAAFMLGRASKKNT